MLFLTKRGRYEISVFGTPEDFPERDDLFTEHSFIVWISPSVFNTYLILLFMGVMTIQMTQNRVNTISGKPNVR